MQLREVQTNCFLFKGPEGTSAGRPSCSEQAESSRSKAPDCTGCSGLASLSARMYCLVKLAGLSCLHFYSTRCPLHCLSRPSRSYFNALIRSSCLPIPKFRNPSQIGPRCPSSSAGYPHRSEQLLAKSYEQYSKSPQLWPLGESSIALFCLQTCWHCWPFLAR